MTTPSAQSVRRALAVQMIIDAEWGLADTENPLQGSYIIEELTDLVEAAVLAEFERIAERGGVLGAMETGYQRGRIQDESMLYEQRKHDGSLPIVGVNTFLADSGAVGLAGHGRARPRHRGGEILAAAAVARVSCQAPRRGAGRLARAAKGRHIWRQRVRCTDGCCPLLLAGSDQRGILRGRRPVPPEHVGRGHVQDH